MEKPPGTLEMSARDAEDMVNAMLLDSPLPDADRSDEGLSEAVEATSFQRRMMARSFLKGAM